MVISKMKILSQNKTEIIDTNSCWIEIEALSNGEAIIVANPYASKNKSIRLGIYKTEEIAKRILSEILETECVNYKEKYSDYGNAFELHYSKKYYEMPSYSHLSNNQPSTNKYVSHPKLGEGKIISETEDKVEIYFPGYGTGMFVREKLKELGVEGIE